MRKIDENQVASIGVGDEFRRRKIAGYLNGVAYAIEPIPADALIELHHELAIAA